MDLIKKSRSFIKSYYAFSKKKKLNYLYELQNIFFQFFDRIDRILEPNFEISK